MKNAKFVCDMFEDLGCSYFSYISPLQTNQEFWSLWTCHQDLKKSVQTPDTFVQDILDNFGLTTSK